MKSVVKAAGQSVNSDFAVTSRLISRILPIAAILTVIATAALILAGIDIWIVTSASRWAVVALLLICLILASTLVVDFVRSGRKKDTRIAVQDDRIRALEREVTGRNELIERLIAALPPELVAYEVVTAVRRSDELLLRVAVPTGNSSETIHLLPSTRYANQFSHIDDQSHFHVKNQATREHLGLFTVIEKNETEGYCLARPVPGTTEPVWWGWMNTRAESHARHDTFAVAILLPREGDYTS